jgi:hypothetical protein
MIYDAMKYAPLSQIIICGTCHEHVEKSKIEEHLMDYHMWG